MKKMWLMELMLVIRNILWEIRMIGSPEVDDKESKMNAHSMVGHVSCSLTKECKGLCDDKIKVNGVKEHSKYKKKENTQNNLKIHYLQDKDDVMVVGIKKESIDFRKGNRNGMSSMYNTRCNPKLEVGKADFRKVPCLFSFCIDQLDLPWNKNETNHKSKEV